MRIVIALLALLAGACMDGGPVRPLPPPRPGPGACDAARGQRFIGRPANPRSIAAVRRATGARTVRRLDPGSMATMDFRPDRVNVDVGENGRIRAVRCG